MQESPKRDKNIFCAILSSIVHFEFQGTVAMSVAFLKTKGMFALLVLQQWEDEELWLQGCL